MVALVAAVLAVAPAMAQQVDLFVQLGHLGPVRAVAWSPDGAFVVSGGASDGSVKCWDAKSGQLVRSNFAHPGGVVSLSMHPSEPTLATVGAEGAAKLWSIDSEQPVSTPPGRGHAVVAWSPDGRTLALGGVDGAIRLWTRGAGQQATAHAHDGEVLSLAWHPDGKLVASSGRDGQVKLWNTSEAEPKLAEAMESATESLAWNPSGTLVAGVGGGKARLWDRRGARQREWAAPGARRVAWSPDGAALAVSQPRAVVLWSALGDRLRAIAVEGAALAWNPAGSAMAVATESGVEVWDASGVRRAVLSGPSEQITSVRWARDASLLTSTVAGGIGRWGASSGEPVKWYDPGGGPSAVAITSDGGLIAAAVGAETRILLEQSGKVLWKLTGHAAPVTSLAFQADGARLATSSADATILLWNMATGELERALRGHKGPVSSVDYAPDGRLASGGDDGVVRIWQRRSRTLEGHTGAVRVVAWSRDGQLASAAADQTVMLWDVGAGRAGRMIAGNAGVTALAWKPTGDKLAVVGVDGAVKIWLTRSGELERVWRGHDGRVASVAWSADGAVIATAGDDSSLRLWNAGNGREIASTTLLPGRQWIVTRRGMLPYSASDGGSRHGALRFGPLGPIQPLTDFEGQLRRSDLAVAWAAPPPQVSPRGGSFRWVLAVLGVVALGGLAAVAGRRILAARAAPRALPPPVYPPEPVFGRDGLVTELAALLVGGSQVGLFGLPKSGKTLVVRQVVAALPHSNVAILSLRGVAALPEAVHRDATRRLRAAGARVLVVEDTDLVDLGALARVFDSLGVLYTATRPSRSVPGHLLAALDDASVPDILQGLADASAIQWSRAAIDAATTFCGGDAHTAHLFAAAVREQAGGRHVDVDHVFAAARRARASFGANPIGRYYRDSLWPAFTDEERAALELAARGPAHTAPGMLLEFGVARWIEDGIEIRSQLLRSWILTRASSVAVKAAAAG